MKNKKNQVNEKSLFLVEDDDNFRNTLAIEFQDRGYQVYTASNLQEFRALNNRRFDFAIVDLKIPGTNGLNIIEEIMQKCPTCRVLVLTGYGSIASAVKALKIGAMDYITKPANLAQIERALLGSKSEPILANEQMIQEPTLAKQEREYIERILVESGGNISEAAKKLGIHRQSLQRKIRKFPPR